MFLEKPYHIEKAFTSQFCDNIINLGKQKKLEEARIKDGNQVNRKSKVSWINEKQEEETSKVINDELIQKLAVKEEVSEVINDELIQKLKMLNSVGSKEEPVDKKDEEEIVSN